MPSIIENALRAALDDLKRKRPGLFAGTKAPIVPHIVRGDGMFSQNAEYYAQTGLNALAEIRKAMRAGSLRDSDVRTVLDFACGYGRVARVLKAAFSDAVLYIFDKDPKAVAACQSILNVRTLTGAEDFSREFPQQFDLIWVGSLFTHIGEADTDALLRFCHHHLSQRGLLIFSTHGPYVAARIRKREKTYNLDPATLDTMLAEFDTERFAFRPYPKRTDYGISLVWAARMAEKIENHDMALVFYEERGWVRHQDIFACRHSPTLPLDI